MSCEGLAGAFNARGVTPEEFRVLAVLGDSEHYGEVAVQLSWLAGKIEMAPADTLRLIRQLSTRDWVALDSKTYEGTEYVYGRIAWPER